MYRECGELFDSHAEGTCISEEFKRIYMDENEEELTEKFPEKCTATITIIGARIEEAES